MTKHARTSARAPGGSRQCRGRRRWVLPVCLAGIAATLVVAGTVSGPSAPRPAARPEPVSVSERPPSPPASLPAAGSPATVDPAPTAAPPQRGPLSLAIPTIAVTSDLVGLGMEEDRTVEVPQDAAEAGWYDLGTVPGQPGSAVILGHVDSTEGPAVFFRLNELTPGAQVLVTLADGTVETFEVARVETIRNEDFPAQRVYAGTPRRPTLALVTCGGDYDEALGGYQSNVIAWAEHVGTAPPS